MAFKHFHFSFSAIKKKRRLYTVERGDRGQITIFSKHVGHSASMALKCA